MLKAILSLTVLLIAAAPASAQDPAIAGRYVFTPTEEGALRLDTRTGAVSLCAGEPAARACTLLPDEARDAAAEPADTGERIAKLEARVAALEAQLRSAGDSLPDEEAVDRVMTLTDRMVRQFFGMVRDLKRDAEGGTL